MKKLIFVFFILSAFSSCTIDEDPESDLSKLLAYSYSENFVKNTLKDPNSAEFVESIVKLIHTDHLGNWEYQIDSYVTATNSFGAKIKTPFLCRLKFDKEKDQVVLLDLKIE